MRQNCNGSKNRVLSDFVERIDGRLQLKHESLDHAQQTSATRALPRLANVTLRRTFAPSSPLEKQAEPPG